MVLSVVPIWVMVVVVFLAFFIFLIKSSNSINVLTFIKKNLFYLFLIIFLAILVISVMNIHKNNDLDLTTLKGVGDAVKIYFNWFISLGKNIAKVTGYAINQDWTASGNSTLK